MYSLQVSCTKGTTNLEVDSVMFTKSAYSIWRPHQQNTNLQQIVRHVAKIYQWMTAQITNMCLRHEW